MTNSETWGIWNKKTKRFVFGIREPSRELAREKFLIFAPRAIHYLLHYTEKQIPEGFVNPPNPNINSYKNMSGW